jgi:hypothetical protein
VKAAGRTPFLGPHRQQYTGPAPSVSVEAVEVLRTTGIHRLEDEGVQYALAVAVLPYAADVFSVWIYAATLLPVLHG